MTDSAIEWHTRMAADFDEKYASRSTFAERYAVWMQVIEKYSGKDKHVLDIGCGSGTFSFFLAARNRSVIGIDASPAMLELCREKKKNSGASNVEFLNCSIESLKQGAGEKADLVICSSVLEYLDDLDDSLALFISLLKKNGILMFSLPNKQSIYRRIEPVLFKLSGRPEYYRFVRHVCALGEIEERLKGMGLNVLESAYYAKTACLSKWFRGPGAFRYTCNLFMVVAELSK